MAAFTIYVDYSGGNDTTGDGTTGTPYATLVKAAATPPSGLASGDTVDIRVRNGASGTLTSQRPVFNNSAWTGVVVTIRPDTGHVNWRATTPSASASEYIVRIFGGTCLPNLVLEDYVWVLDTNQQAVQWLNTVASADYDTTLRRGATSWASWNFANNLVSGPAVTNHGNVTIESCTVTGVAKVVSFAGLAGTLSMRSNAFTLGGGAGTWRVIDFSQAFDGRHAPTIISSGNTWSGALADGFTFIGGYKPLITRRNKTWTFDGDTFNLSSTASAAKFINIEDCDSASTHTLSIMFIKTPIYMNTTGTVFNLGRNIGSYINSQMPRLATLNNDCTRKLAQVTIENSLWQNINADSAAALLAIRLGVLATRIERSEMDCPNSDSHSCNFLANDVVLKSSRLTGELPCLAFGDRITVDRCYIRGVRPFVAGKTGGGPDEASQGHTITNSTFVCTSSDPELSAMDTYGWQANDPYGTTWYSAGDTPGAGGSSKGLVGWTVMNNVFVAPNGAAPIGLGRPAGAASHAVGKFTSVAAMDEFLADGNGGEGPWIDGTSEFSGNVLITGSEPILSDILADLAVKTSTQIADDITDGTNNWDDGKPALALATVSAMNSDGTQTIARTNAATAATQSTTAATQAAAAATQTTSAAIKSAVRLGVSGRWLNLGTAEDRDDISVGDIP